jgi:ketosteroid isomerase-like protein
MIFGRWLFLIAGIAMVTSCARGPADLESQRAALMQTSRDWARAAATGDLDRVVSYWADDALVLPPDQPTMAGKAAIREFVRASREIPGFSITWEPEKASISDDGKLGYLVERNRVTFVDAKGVAQTQHGKAITVWRKDTAGAWKCVIDMWNNNPKVPVLAEGGQVN